MSLIGQYNGLLSYQKSNLLNILDIQYQNLKISQIGVQNLI